MGLSARFLWPIVTFAVIAAAILVYFLFPPYCQSCDSPSDNVPPVTTPAQPTTEEPQNGDFRLPTNVRPSSYDILLHPDLTTGMFTGKVSILINVSEPAEELKVHIDGLTVVDTRVSTVLGDKVQLDRSFEHKPYQFWVVHPKQRLPTGEYLLDFDFHGGMLDKIEGLYMSSYSLNNTQERNIATTKFEPTYARRAFPCFDEPSFKAKYNVKLVRPSTGNYIALSNMNQVDEVADSPSPGLTTVKFATSVPMSTYLACFIVCDFEHLPPMKSKRGFDVNVYARSGQIQKMEYAQKIAASTIDFYIDYFGIDYPLPKLDLIAIPDFVSGAMENWGLITFRETSVLYHPESSSSSNHMAVTLTTTHELAHMWFGDLVTMKWWDDLWLNEGFASFIEFKGTAHNHPDWDLDAYFLYYEMTDALNLDSTLSSHPIIVHVAHPDKITEIFDRISYAKGAAVIRMLEGFMGAESFRKGVVSYLETYKYNNAETVDLWRHLNKFSQGVDIPRVMDTWTKQMGLPVLTVVQNGDTLTVTQQRFTANKNATYDPNESIYKYKWDVPVTYITSENKTATLKWLLMESPSLSIKIGNVEWYKLNWHFMNYYRVNYPPAQWSALTSLLLKDIKALDAHDRTNLVDDAFSLAESGHLDYSVALGVTGFLSKEDHLVVWSVARDRLLSMHSHLQYTPAYSDFRRYLKKLITPHVNDALWEFPPDASFLQRSQQALMISLACRVGVPSCLNKAKQLFTTWLQNSSSKPHVEIRGTVYFYGVAESGEEEWDKVWDIYLAESDPQEKLKLRSALSATKEPWIISRFLERIKNEDYVRSQDFFTAVGYVGDNPIGNPIVWDWVRTNWQYMVDRFTLNNRLFGRLLPGLVGTYDSEVKLKELQTFLAQNPEEGAGGSGRKTAVEAIQLNIAWRERHLPTLTDWLKNA